MPIFRDRKAQRMGRAGTWEKPGMLFWRKVAGVSQRYRTLSIQASGAAGLTPRRTCGSVQAQQWMELRAAQDTKGFTALSSRGLRAAEKHQEGETPAPASEKGPA